MPSLSSDEESNHENVDEDNESDSHSDIHFLNGVTTISTNDFYNINNLIETDEDSDVEFQRILDACRKKVKWVNEQKQNGEENKDRLKSRNPCQEKMFDSEYNTLPPIEFLNINVEEDDRLEKFGIVDSHIGYIVKIIPMDGVPHLGYETILFDTERNPLGEIFEVFGTVTSTMYAVRFNSKDEAEEKMPIGKELFYAVTNENITKTVFPEQLAKLKNWERHRSNMDDSSSDELFSDDEEEQRHMAKKRQKTRHRKNSNQSIASISTVPPKRKKIWQKWPGRQSNPFHPQHNQRQQQIQMARTSTSYQQSAMQLPYAYSSYPYAYPYYSMPNEQYIQPSQFMQNPILYNLQNPPPPPPSSSQQQNPNFPTAYQFFNTQNFTHQRPYRRSSPST